MAHDASEAVDAVAAAAVAALAERELTVAVAESLTGGALGAALTSVPGASAVFRGGIVAYATPLKTALLGVSPRLLAEAGPVHADVAAAMAAGARARLGADCSVALTGVAGPEPQGGASPGTVWIGLSSDRGHRTELLSLSGSRAEIRSAAVRQALELLVSHLEGSGGQPPNASRSGGRTAG